MADDLETIASTVLLRRAVDLESRGLDYEVVARILTEPSTVRLLFSALAEHRAALVAWLVEAGVLVPADVWERPEIDLDALEKAKARYYQDNNQRLDDEADGRPWSQDMVDAMLARSRGWHDRQRILDGPRVYFEGEERPERAVPLYRVADEGMRVAEARGLTGRAEG